jgi:hypothetical protein
MAYYGICHPDNPNCFWLLGPGTGLGKTVNLCCWIFLSIFLFYSFFDGLVAALLLFLFYCIFFSFIHSSSHHIHTSLFASLHFFIAWCSVGKTSLGAEPRFELGPALKYTYPDPYFEFEDSYKKVLNPYTGILYTTKYRKILL